MLVKNFHFNLILKNTLTCKTFFKINGKDETEFRLNVDEKYSLLINVRVDKKSGKNYNFYKLVY